MSWELGTKKLTIRKLAIGMPDRCTFAPGPDHQLSSDEREDAAAVPAAAAGIERDAMFARVAALGLPPDDFAVFGSGPMLAHRMIRTIGDIDMVARGAAWAAAVRLSTAPPRRPRSGVGMAVELPDAGRGVEIYTEWPGESVDTLIDGSELVGGVRFVQLEAVLRYKLLRGRQKDLKHVELLSDALATISPTASANVHK